MSAVPQTDGYGLFALRDYFWYATYITLLRCYETYRLCNFVQLCCVHTTIGDTHASRPVATYSVCVHHHLQCVDLLNAHGSSFCAYRAAYCDECISRYPPTIVPLVCEHTSDVMALCSDFPDGDIVLHNGNVVVDYCVMNDKSTLVLAYSMAMLRETTHMFDIYGNATAADLQELETFEMACLRRIARTSLLAHRTSDSVRQQLEIGPAVAEVVRQCRLRYLGHVLRMDSRRQPLIALRSAIGSKKQGKGRPLKTWVQCVTDDLQSRSLNMKDVERMLAPCHQGDEVESEKAKGEYRRRVVFGNKSFRASMANPVP